MAQRLELQTLLESFVDNVYFQPPTNVKMQYPCIVYSRDSARTEFADNNPFSFTWRYAVTIIDRNPDSEIIELVAAMPRCTFERHFVADDLNHDVFNIYF